MRLAVCDYPEHVPYSLWRSYPERMKALGLEVVRVAEFGWSRFEPERGAWHTDWLDRALEDLHAADLKVILGTPTAAPPPWLVREAPEILPVNAQGQRLNGGSRRHYDYSSPRYLEESARIVERLARHYGEHPAVIGWQTDNEHGCHNTTRSYSAAALTGFRAWLEAKYGTVAALNEAWGAVFWSQAYRRFDEVTLPNLAPHTPNPSQRLDFYRYSSERVVLYDRMQADILRQYSPGRFVTHNFMSFFSDFDHYRAAEHLDFPSFDSYPTGMLPNSVLPADLKQRYARCGYPDLTGFNHDLYRGLKRGVGHWIMEQQCGHIDWSASNSLPQRGSVALWTLQALAHGAEGVSYFRWRAATLGSELMHSGLLKHDGEPDRGFPEVACSAPLVQTTDSRRSRAPSPPRRLAARLREPLGV